MVHEDLYPDMDPDYRSRMFLARDRLLGTIESSTLLPTAGLSARGLLDEGQMAVVAKIRTKRLAPVLDRFIRD